MNALQIAPLVEVLTELAAQLGRVAAGLASAPPAGPIGEVGDVVTKLHTIRAGLLGIEQPDEEGANLALAKVEGIEIAINMLGGKVPEERRRTIAAGVGKLPREFWDRPGTTLNGKPFDGKIAAASYVDGTLPPAIELSTMDRRILEALAQRLGKHTTLAQCALFARYSVSGDFTSAIARLRRERLIEGPGSDLKLTLYGLRLVPDTVAPLSSSALFESWRSKVSTMQGRLLTAFDGGETTLTMDEIADRTGYAISGDFTSAIARLVALKLIVRTKPKTYELAAELRP